MLGTVRKNSTAYVVITYKTQKMYSFIWNLPYLGTLFLDLSLSVTLDYFSNPSSYLSYHCFFFLPQSVVCMLCLVPFRHTVNK